MQNIEYSDLSPNTLNFTQFHDFPEVKLRKVHVESVNKLKLVVFEVLKVREARCGEAGVPTVPLQRHMLR